MDMTNDQIIDEFKRQVYLCSGLGKQKMLEIVNTQFAERAHSWYKHGSHCIRCGAKPDSLQALQGCYQ